MKTNTATELNLISAEIIAWSGLVWEGKYSKKSQIFLACCG